MKKTLHISADLTLPLEAVTQTFAILARKRELEKKPAAPMKTRELQIVGGAELNRFEKAAERIEKTGMDIIERLAGWSAQMGKT